MKTTNRREFLAAVTAGTLAGGRLAYGAAAGRKLKLALIGCGWYGMIDLVAALKSGNTEAAALCDVDSGHLESGAKEVAKLQGSHPKTFKDYRDLIGTPGIDAIFIATPPQWHALPFIAACEKGLHIYCEKPLAYDIREGQAMVDAARKAGNVVQVGFQRRQSDAFREAAEYIRSGAPGRIVQVDVQIHYRAIMLDTTAQPPPPSLDWDFWCGPAPRLPYNPNIGHRTWRLEKEYGNGHLVDWGIHLMDAVRVILAERTPRSVTATGGLLELKGKITTPDALTVDFEFEKCPVVWRHRLWGANEYTPELNNGVLFYGSRETVFATDSRWAIISGAKETDRRVMPAKISGGDQQARHVTEFLDAVRRGRQPSCTPEDAADSAATVQLAMISYYTGSRVVWDAGKKEIAGNPAAQKLLKREYRAPWNHPYHA